MIEGISHDVQATSDVDESQATSLLWSRGWPRSILDEARCTGTERDGEAEETSAIRWLMMTGVTALTRLGLSYRGHDREAARSKGRRDPEGRLRRGNHVMPGGPGMDGPDLHDKIPVL